MTAFTLNTASGDKNIDELVTKAGGDTYSINNGTTLTIDQDSRYGLNQTTATSLGSITVAATGGTVLIDGRYVRLIPYDTGSGNVPAGGTVISQGSVTGKLIGVWSAINVAPTAAGSAMPASGFVKVKQVSGAYAAGSLTGIGANATGADIAGWIEIVGDESATMTLPRLGTCDIKGAWFDVGTTDGVTTTTYQLPTSGSAQYFAGVFVSKTSSPTVDADYEFYPNVGDIAGANVIGTDEVRGKVCWIGTGGVLRLGHDGTNEIGYCPPTGRKLVIGNVILENCVTTTRTVNALPNATLATRYDFTTTNNGSIRFDKVMMAWYMNASAAYSLIFSNTAICSRFDMYQPGTRVSFTRVGVGVATPLICQAFVPVSCVNGGDFTDCVFAVLGGATSLGINAQDCRDFIFQNTKAIYVGNYNQYFTCGAIQLVRCDNFSFDTTLLGTGNFSCSYCTDLTVRNTTTYSRIGTAATRSTAPPIYFSTKTQNALVDGLNWPDADARPGSTPVTVEYYLTKNIEFRNLGSPSKPLAMDGVGSAIAKISPEAGGEVRIRRVWYSNSTVYGNLNSPKTQVGLLVDNMYAVGAGTDVIRGMTAAGMRVRGYRGHSIEVYNGLSPGIYGSHWFDGYTTDTAGLFWWVMAEPSEQSAPYFTLTGTASFTGTSLQLPAIGDSITAEMDYSMLGHTGFSSATSPALQNGTFTNHKYAFQYDTGSGWSAWSSDYTVATDLRDALAGITVDYAVGVKMRLKITTTVANTSLITGFVLYTTTTAEAQQTLYPLGSATVVVNGLATGSVVKATKVSDGTSLFVGTEASGSISFSTSYEGAIAIEARKASSAPYYRPWVSQINSVFGTTVTATALQQLDE